MMEIALSTATQRRPFLPFLPLTVSQRRRRSLDDAAPTSCDRRRHAETDPNAGGARSPRPVNPSTCRASVVPASRKQTLALLKSPRVVYFDVGTPHRAVFKGIFADAVSA